MHLLLEVLAVVVAMEEYGETDSEEMPHDRGLAEVVLAVAAEP